MRYSCVDILRLLCIKVTGIVMSILGEFKDFIMKGDVVDLAVAVVIGLAFNAVVTALVVDIITPIIGIPGHVNFASITYTINGSTFLIGAFLNALITFLSVAVAVFFFVVKPVEKMKNFNKKPVEAKTPDTKKCPYCLSDISLKATRCAFCTSKLSE